MRTLLCADHCIRLLVSSSRAATGFKSYIRYLEMIQPGIVTVSWALAVWVSVVGGPYELEVLRWWLFFCLPAGMHLFYAFRVVACCPIPTASAGK